MIHPNKQFDLLYNKQNKISSFIHLYSKELYNTQIIDSGYEFMVSGPPQHLLPWLTCRTNLTEQLHAKSGDTALHVIQQTWEPANAWDRQMLSLEPGQVLHRDIVMRAWQQPCWFARTILPEKTYQAHLSIFERLKHESLGNLIFQTPSIQRLALRHYAIEPSSPEYTWLSASTQVDAQQLWARLSEFLVRDGAEDHDVTLFYLVEILLPHLEQYC